MSLVKSGDLAVRTAQPFRFVAPSERSADCEPSLEHTPHSSNNPEFAGLETGVQLGEVVKEASFLEQIAELQQALAKAKSEIEEAKTASFESGKKEGFNAACKLAEERYILLRDALADGQECMARGIDEQFRVAIEIARTIVQSVLGDQAQLKEHVIQTASMWKRELAESSIVGIRVSTKDFPDAKELLQIEELLGRTKIETDPSLDHGACLFDLSLGTLNASIPHQLENSNEFLNAQLPSEARK